MIYKTIIPDAEQLNQSPVEILKIGSRGLDKTASMTKRAGLFQKQISQIKPMQKKAYLHVITTGAQEFFGPNKNGDAFNQDYKTIHPPLAKTAACMTIQLDGGLKKYHDKSYSNGAHVYQEHQTEAQGAQPSGIVKCAKYNEAMHRGQLLIEVDAQKWAPRLQKRASGQDIFLSIGCQVSHDTCSACGNKAHTLEQHCNHVNMHKLATLQDGTRVCMFNDKPQFYDISGVNTPADPMAFVLRKVASGSPASVIIPNKYCMAARRGMPFNKAASMLSKLSNIQKQIICKPQDDLLFMDQPQAQKQFLSAVENYPTDQVIDQCNRKAILMSPSTLFKLMGKDTNERDLFNLFAQKCPICGRHLMQDMEQDQEFPKELTDGSFDSTLPTDLSLSSILDKFIPQLGVSRPALNGKSIRITIRMGMMPKSMKNVQTGLQEAKQESDSNAAPQKQTQEQDIKKTASLVGDQFRRTYARYLIGFAAKNNQDTCRLAMQKVARYI